MKVRAYLNDKVVIGYILSEGIDKRGFIKWEICFIDGGEEKKAVTQHITTLDGKIFCIGCGEHFISHEKKTFALCKNCEKEASICRDCKLETFEYELIDEEPVCIECLEENYTQCDDCGAWVSNDEYYSTAYDTSICQICYENNYFYCERCEQIYHNDDYGEDGCCYHCCDEEKNNGFYLSEEEIEISDEISKKLQKLLYKPLPTLNLRLCQGNLNDYRIRELISAVGEVLYPVYLFGLKDREKYEISLPHILFKRYKNSRWGYAFKAIENSSINKIGISLNLRKNQFNRIVRLIKFLTRR